MRASTARFLSSDVRLFDLDFPSTGKMIARTRMAFIHLDNVLAYAKRDRDGMVDAYLAAYLPEELIILFFRKGEIINAATLRSDGRRLLPIAEALRRMKAETEPKEVVAHDLVAIQRELPVQALPTQVKLFRDVQGRIVSAADKELMGEANRKHQRVSASLAVQHPALELLALPEYGAPPALVVTVEDLTAAFAAWTSKLLHDVELV